MLLLLEEALVGQQAVILEITQAVAAVRVDTRLALLPALEVFRKP
jgi:hypothetical protein